MKKTISWTACFVVFIALANSCTKDSKNEEPSTVDCSTITTTFSGQVRPLIASSCAKPDCHAAGSSNGPGALTDYNQIFNARARIRTSVANGSMPQDATLSPTQKAIITCWIDAGAPNN
ncbi:hypothetical protein [Longitalea luteola]|uniref:hypothetical protein n=1 Tax=Longitalea luteola TaxID=2812563 RepID=UPI001A966125|nr:hypothetical protein [Longitalea luteola]